MQIIDISRDLTTATLYPGSKPVGLKQLSSVARGDLCTLTALTADLHAGTHVDAPLHFIDKGADIASMPLAHFIGPCQVVSVESGELKASSLLKRLPFGTKRILLKNSFETFLTSACAQALAEQKILTLGVEGLSPAPFNNEKEIHTTLLFAKIALIESLDLSQTEDGEYFLSAAPIKISGGEAAFTRAVLIRF
ncbi:MAG: cyclase family protein [Eubacteriaceae bacterium]|nr:cyclase family protein [Eubacteriaceae bacterium]